MLTIDAEYIFKVSLLRSDRWLYKLLSSNGTKRTKGVAYLSLLDYQQNDHRKEDNIALLSSLDAQSLSMNYDLSFIDEMGTRFLSWKGNSFEAKLEYLDEWQAICSYIDPLLVISWMYAEMLKLNKIQPDQLSLVSQCPQALQFDDNLKYGDNHAHLGGNGSHRKAILEFSLFPYSPKGKTHTPPQLSEFSFINSGLINDSELPRLLHSLFNVLIERSLFEKSDNNKYILPNFSDLISLRQKNLSLQSLIQFSGDSVFHQLLKDAFNSDSDQGCLLLYTALFYAERYMELGEEWKTALRAFIHTSQILRASMIHKGVGLGYFVEYFRHNLRKGKSENAYVRYSLATDITKNIFREFKVSPKMAERKSLKNMSEYLFKKGYENNIHFCLHFTRSGNPKNKLQREFRLKLERERNRLTRLFSSVEIQQTTIKKSVLDTAKHSVNLLNLLRGLDVAGNENELPIEVFAPSLRYLRTSPWQCPHPSYKPTRQLHLSVHVGEDFQHLISGLRHIDETVTFCEMGHDDRLGHALALGINPKLWVERQGTVFINAGEHLDNLVWLHHQTIKIALKCPDISPYTAILAEKIAHWSHYIFDQSHDPRSLYEAWELRRNCPITYMKLKNSEGLDLLSALIPDFIDRKPSKKIINLWESYFMSANKHSNYNDKYQTIVKVKHLREGHPDAITDASKGIDFFSLDEVHYISAIQDYLMNIFDQKGLVIEACPSSNIYAGHFKSYDEHPIYRWTPPNKQTLIKGEVNNLFGLRNGPVKVCINTDDAGLFPTTIANEHRVIKETAIKDFSICSEEADIWINRIREIGVQEFKKNKMPFFN